MVHCDGDIAAHYGASGTVANTWRARPTRAWSLVPRPYIGGYWRALVSWTAAHTMIALGEGTWS